MLRKRLNRWLGSSSAADRRPIAHRIRRNLYQRRLALESLEDRRVLSTIAVTTFDDVVDPSDGVTSLREAVSQASTATDDVVIQLGPGTYNLTRINTGGDNDNNLNGDLDLSQVNGRKITIQGSGPDSTILDAGGETGLNDRVLHVLSDVNAEVRLLRITGGSAVDGGGINNEGTLHVDLSLIDHNTASNNGGGIFTESDTLVVTLSTISHNTSANLGGGIGVGISAISSASLYVDQSTISENAAYQGGGIFLSGSVSTIIGSTISQNLASFGGGILNFYSLSNVVSCTITRNELRVNSPSRIGGGIFANEAQLTVSNSIVAQNLASSGRDIYQLSLGGIRSLGHNYFGELQADQDDLAIASDQWGTPEAPIDPLLGPLTRNGGPTSTHEPLPRSPVVDVISPGDVVQGVDQRGSARIHNDLADIGAVELIAFEVNVASDSQDVSPGDGVAEDANGNTSLRAAVMEANAFLGFPTTILFDPALDGQPLTLSLSGVGEDESATGDLDIRGVVRILGNGISKTIIDAGGATGMNDRVLHVLPGASLELRDVTVTGGAGVEWGGGLLNEGTLEVFASNITQNTSTLFGGGIASDQGTTTIAGSTVSQNTAHFGGGGYLVNSSLSMATSTVSENLASLDGGGIYNFHSSATITNSTFSQNAANYYGGAISNVAGTLSLDAVTVTQNRADSSDQGFATGGGLYLYEGYAEIANSIIAQNLASSGQDLSADHGGNITSLGHNLFGEVETTPAPAGLPEAGLPVYWDGSGHYYQVVAVPGGVFYDDAKSAALAAGGHLATITSQEEHDFIVSLINDPQYWNAIHGPWIGGEQLPGHAPDAGWEWVTGEPFSFAAWFDGNPNDSAIQDEDRLHMFDRNAGDHGDAGWNDQVESGIVISYVIEYEALSPLSSDLWGTPNSPLDPMLGPLQDNGGLTLTHEPLLGSPAVNVIPAGATQLTTDQRGARRVIDRLGDIGAVETITFTVNIANDSQDVSPGDGVPEDANGNTSLRAAVMEGNAIGFPTNILFDPALDGQPLTLSLSGVDEDDSATGDLDIRGVVRILGNGISKTIIDAGGATGLNDRVLHVLPDASLELRGITVTGGAGVEDGAGLLVNAGTLEVSHSKITRNISSSFGGGIYSDQGTLTITNSTVSDNVSIAAGGISVSSSVVEIASSTIADNHSSTYGGGILTADSSTTITSSTVSRNSTYGEGGGIVNIASTLKLFRYDKPDKWERIEEVVNEPFQIGAESEKLHVKIPDFGDERKPYLIDEHFQTGKLVYLIADQGSGKTFLALDWALCIASGKPYLGCYDVRQSRVLYVGEEGFDENKERVKGWMKVYPDADPVENFAFMPHDFNLRTSADLNRLIRAGSDTFDGEHPDIIFIDTVANNLMGGDENSPKDMSAFVSTLKQLSAKTGATVVCLAHPGHEDKSRARGFSNQEAACDSVFIMHGSPKKGKARLENKKQKAGRTLDDYWLTFADTPAVAFKPDGTPITSLVISSHQESIQDVLEGLSDFNRQFAYRLAEQYGEKPFTFGAAVQLAQQGDKGCSKRTAERWVAVLADAGVVIKEKTGDGYTVSKSLLSVA